MTCDVSVSECSLGSSVFGSVVFSIRNVSLIKSDVPVSEFSATGSTSGSVTCVVSICAVAPSLSSGISSRTIFVSWLGNCSTDTTVMADSYDLSSKSCSASCPSADVSAAFSSISPASICDPIKAPSLSVFGSTTSVFSTCVSFSSSPSVSFISLTSLTIFISELRSSWASFQISSSRVSSLADNMRGFSSSSSLSSVSICSCSLFFCCDSFSFCWGLNSFSSVLKVTVSSDLSWSCCFKSFSSSTGSLLSLTSDISSTKFSPSSFFLFWAWLSPIFFKSLVFLFTAWGVPSSLSERPSFFPSTISPLSIVTSSLPTFSPPSSWSIFSCFSSFSSGFFFPCFDFFNFLNERKILGFLFLFEESCPVSSTVVAFCSFPSGELDSLSTDTSSVPYASNVSFACGSTSFVSFTLGSSSLFSELFSSVSIAPSASPCWPSVLLTSSFCLPAESTSLSLVFAFGSSSPFANFLLFAWLLFLFKVRNDFFFFVASSSFFSPSTSAASTTALGSFKSKSTRTGSFDSMTAFSETSPFVSSSFDSWVSFSGTSTSLFLFVITAFFLLRPKLGKCFTFLLLLPLPTDFSFFPSRELSASLLFTSSGFAPCSICLSPFPSVFNSIVSYSCLVILSLSPVQIPVSSVMSSASITSADDSGLLLEFFFERSKMKDERLFFLLPSVWSCLTCSTMDFPCSPLDSLFLFVDFSLVLFSCSVSPAPAPVAWSLWLALESSPFSAVFSVSSFVALIWLLFSTFAWETSWLPSTFCSSLTRVGHSWLFSSVPSVNFARNFLPCLRFFFDSFFGSFLVLAIGFSNPVDFELSAIFSSLVVISLLLLWYQNVSCKSE